MPDHERRRRRLLLRERQELDGKLTHHVAVERHQFLDPEEVENGEQQERVFRSFSERFSLFDQQACPLHSRSGFRRRVATNMQEWGYERYLKLDLFATQRGCGGQGRDLVERKRDLLYGFN